MNAKESGDISGGAACVKHGENLSLSLGREFGLPPALAALSSCRAKTCLGSLADHGALEFGESAEHLHHHAARSRVLFVSVLCGPDSYRYIGMLGENGDFRVTAKTCPAKDATAIAAFRFCIVNLARGVIPATLEIRHMGRCGCCGRKITTPGSLDSGISPECAAKVGLPSAKLARKAAVKKVDPIVAEMHERAEREHTASKEFWRAYRAAPVSPLAGILERFAAVHC